MVQVPHSASPGKNGKYLCAVEGPNCAETSPFSDDRQRDTNSQGLIVFMMKCLHGESQRPSQSLMDFRRTMKLSEDRAHLQRFGRPLNWKETIMFTVDMHVAEMSVSTA